MKKPFRVAITTGDPDGVGYEVTAKALNKIRPQKGVQFFLWRSPNRIKKYDRLIDRYFKRVNCHSWPDALRLSTDYYKDIVEIESPLSPGQWVEVMTQSALSQAVDGLVTAPLSKANLHTSGMKDCGHNDIFKRVTKNKNIFMCFLGEQFNVSLATGHIPTEKACRSISLELLQHCVTETAKLLPLLPKKQKTKPIGLLGLNPHAGENGLIGNQETNIHHVLIKKYNQRKLDLKGPLVPDVCFQKSYQTKYSFFIANYHDQGLIPFKMAHGQEKGVQQSIGLPFVRTSVDHGTAKDIFDKNRANSTSMEYALKIAIQQLKKQTIKW